MAKKFYLGDTNNIARSVSKLYVGVNGIAKKVKKLYIGDPSGIAREVYSGGSGVDPTKNTFTEAEFLGVIADGNQALMHVGATITLSNTYCDTYEVIGINHDNTTGTVDIMAHTQVGNQKFDSGSSSSVYSGSSIRTWINDTYLNAFSENIRNAAKTMDVVTKNGIITTTTNDKVKLLSATEIGMTHTYAFTGEGSLYTGVFTPGGINESITDRWRAAGTYGNSSRYWLRSLYTNTTGYVWCVNNTGTCSNQSYLQAYGILPVLRF